MPNVSVNFKEVTGKVKPMHAVNNGPVYKFAADQRITNIDAFREAGIPYARNHDASFYATYGGNHTVDVAFIFPDFDADPTDPASYDFACTDEYMKVMYYAGVKCFYRLGHRIEHEVKKYGTLPPKDFHKWAVVCEHIIRHYTEGWANGFTYDVEYWEIWNEPDLDPDDSPNKRCWGGTQAEFFELYHITATHLKACFPHLKIGGPAVSGSLNWSRAFLSQLRAPLDFFSWHIYTNRIEKAIERAEAMRALLDEYGFQSTESILNEWNYVRSWEPAILRYSYAQQNKSKGASFSLAMMCAAQKSSIDLLMYYDARPMTNWNGMFDMTQIEHSTLTGYYPFPMFNVLYRMGTEVSSSADDPTLFVCAARDGEGAAVVLTHYNEEDDTEKKPVCVELMGLGERTEAEFYLLDDDHRLTLTQKLTFCGERFAWEIDVPNHTSYLILSKFMSSSWFAITLR